MVREDTDQGDDERVREDTNLRKRKLLASPCPPSSCPHEPLTRQQNHPDERVREDTNLGKGKLISSPFSVVRVLTNPLTLQQNRTDKGP